MRWLAISLSVLLGCASAGGAAAQGDPTEARAALVDALRDEGIRDERVLAAIGRVERHRLVPAPLRAMAYEDRPLPIGHDQTISQPYVVAWMTELAALPPPGRCRVLEVGTGSGYQAAVLAEMGCEVWTIEIVEPLARRAEEDLRELGYGDRVHVRAGDGYAGWPDEAPFDAILITAAPDEIPAPLPPQLRAGGRLVAPVGDEGGEHELVVVTRRADGSLDRRREGWVRFVPMTGEAQRR